MAHETNLTTVQDVIDNWPYEAQNPHTDDDIGEYLSSFVTSLQTVDQTLADLHDNQFIKSADLPQLRKIGQRVGVTPNDGEKVEAFRYRVRVEHAVAASNGTADDIEAVIESALGDEALNDTVIDVTNGSPELAALINERYIGEKPYDRETIESLIERALPCGWGFRTALSEKAFAFYTDENDAPAYTGGFSEGAWISSD